MKKKRVSRAFIRRQLESNFWGFGAMLFMTVALASGCGKKTANPPPSASQAPSESQTNQSSTPVAQAPSGNRPAVSQTNGEPDLRALDRVLIRWIVGHKRRPADFQEFASTAGTPIPPPPPGKKYTILPNMHIELVNQ